MANKDRFLVYLRGVPMTLVLSIITLFSFSNVLLSEEWQVQESINGGNRKLSLKTDNFEAKGIQVLVNNEKGTRETWTINDLILSLSYDEGDKRAVSLVELSREFTFSFILNGVVAGFTGDFVIINQVRHGPILVLRKKEGERFFGIMSSPAERDAIGRVAKEQDAALDELFKKMKQ